MSEETKIAGLKKIKDWKAIKTGLLSGADSKLWEKAFNEFLLIRILTRYFEPIEAISGIPKRQGKGFSIIAIYCSLIEFFETLKKGYEFSNRNYKDKSGVIVRSSLRQDKYNQYLPLSTEEIFVNFLTENSPFDKIFTVVLAKRFYSEIRCPILHQAETASNWLIKDGGQYDPLVFDDSHNNKMILRWNPLRLLFIDYLERRYKQLLLSDKKVQRNFIFKWDKICGI